MRVFGSSCLLLLFALASRPAAACSCVGGGFGEYEPCEAWNSAAIFSGKVTGLTYVMPDGTETTEIPDSRPDHRVYHFDVIESFVGVEGKTADIVTGMGDGDCGVDFAVGESYFIYAGGEPGVALSVYMCGDMSKPLSNAGYDIEFARQVQRGEWLAIYGRVTTLTRENLYDRADGEAMAGVTVRLWGPYGRRFEAVTKENGYFTVMGRLRGTYTVRAVMPEGFPTPAEQEVEVFPDECSGVEIVASSLGSIQGRVVDLDGKPAGSMEVALMPVDEPHDAYQIETADTDEEGRYRFEDIPAGVYLVAANHEGPGTYGPPYPPTYYPQTVKLADAGRVTLKPAQSLKLEDIRLPPPIPSHEAKPDQR